jgi:demethylmenaquinone methyltransferase/2-methoxy-6-polyprenyl-1,4-benzoquinol methylase
MEVTPYHSKEPKKIQVRNMFNAVAKRYDFLNHFLSLGIDKIWRRKTIREIEKLKPGRILDIATGTADLAIAASQLHPQSITGIDISDNMLDIGRIKIEKQGLQQMITLMSGDCENLQFNNASFDAVMVAFGVRNFQNLDAGIREMKRVLSDQGKVYILEFSQPEKFPIKQFYHLYSRYMLPVLGRIISGDAAAYTYLPESVKHFPSGKAFASVLEKGGFKQVEIKPMTFGIVTLYIASA